MQPPTPPTETPYLPLPDHEQWRREYSRVVQLLGGGDVGGDVASGEGDVVSPEPGTDFRALGQVCWV